MIPLRAKSKDTIGSYFAYLCILYFVSQSMSGGLCQLINGIIFYLSIGLWCVVRTSKPWTIITIAVTLPTWSQYQAGADLIYLFVYFSFTTFPRNESWIRTINSPTDRQVYLSMHTVKMPDFDFVDDVTMCASCGKTCCSVSYARTTHGTLVARETNDIFSLLMSPSQEIIHHHVCMIGN